MIKQLNPNVKRVLSITLRAVVWIIYTLALNHAISNGLPKFFWDAINDPQALLAWFVLPLLSYMGLLKIVDHIQEWFSK